MQSLATRALVITEEFNSDWSGTLTQSFGCVSGECGDRKRREREWNGRKA